MSDDQLDDEAPPDIPDINSDPEIAPIPALPSQIPPSVPIPVAQTRAKSDPDIDVEIDVEMPSSEPGEEIEPEVVPAEEEVVPPLPPPRKRMQTNPATPVARASMPPPAADAAEAASPTHDSLKPPRAPSIADLDEPTTRMADTDFDEPTAKREDAAGVVRPMLALELPEEMAPPPRPASQPPRPVSQPPRPVSQPPRPLSQPPRPISPPRPASNPPPEPSAAATRESEPPTEPWHAPPPEDHAATSYPPPPLQHDEIPADPADHPPVSLKPMRVIGVKSHASVPPAKPVAPVEVAKPPPPPPIPKQEVVAKAAAPVPDELSDEDFAPESSEAAEEGEITFPADEVSSEAASPSALSEDEVEVPPERESEPEIAVEVEEPAQETPAAPAAAAAAGGPAPPPPPRREPPKPPSVAEAKEAQRTKQRKAWWEELFGEDFARANAKLKSPQIVHEADFIEESLGVAKGGVLLDLACGGGQHAVELAQRGYGVVGYDLSLYQLAVAADVAQEYGQKLNLLQGDMREMAFEEMFDGIYCWNTSFGYFEEEKNQAVAQRILRALRPGGMFLLDVANRDYVVANQPAQTWFEGDACVCMDDMAVDFITSRLRVKRSLILDDGRTMECAYSIRLYSLHELGKILHDAGFRVTEASGHPATPGVFFGASSPRILILAQRP